MAKHTELAHSDFFASLLVTEIEIGSVKLTTQEWLDRMSDNAPKGFLRALQLGLSTGVSNARSIARETQADHLSEMGLENDAAIMSRQGSKVSELSLEGQQAIAEFKASAESEAQDHILNGTVGAGGGGGGRRKTYDSFFAEQAFEHFKLFAKAKGSKLDTKLNSKGNEVPDMDAIRSKIEIWLASERTEPGATETNGSIRFNAVTKAATALWDAYQEAGGTTKAPKAPKEARQTLSADDLA